MISVEAARNLILTTQLGSQVESITLERALGRVIAQEVFADDDQPAFNRSAMDGYAFAESRLGAEPGYRVIGTSLPGTDPNQLADLGPGQCYRVFTGAPLPEKIRRVVPQENVTAKDALVTVSAESAAIEGPSYVRHRGEDVKKGALLISPGVRLGPAELSVLAAVGLVKVNVAKIPRVIHVSTGDELVEPSLVSGPGQIRDCNGALIRGLVLQAGGSMVNQFRVGDHPEEVINAVLSAGEEPDLLLISGGASVGEHDHTASVLDSLGYQIHFRNVDVRPGKPLIFATKGGRIAFGIPGNPVSHFVVFHLFIRPLIARMCAAATDNPWQEGFLSEPLVDGVKNSRETYWPALARLREGVMELRPLAWRSSGHLASLLGVNALIRIPPNSVSFSAKTRLTWFAIN